MMIWNDENDLNSNFNDEKCEKLNWRDDFDVKSSRIVMNSINKMNEINKMNDVEMKNNDVFMIFDDSNIIEKMNLSCCSNNDWYRCKTFLTMSWFVLN